MSGDLVALAAAASPYVVSAAGAYGGAVLARVQDEAVDATVGWGRKILQRIFGTDLDEARVPKELRRLVAEPDDADLQAAFRVYLRELLATDPQLAEDLGQLVAQAGAASGNTVTASQRGVAAGRDITAPVTTGDHSPIKGQ